jgi:prephenate dehydrogenase
MTSASRIAVIGTGLVGTSIAMAARRGSDVVRGYDLDRDVLRRAAEHGEFEAAESVGSCVDGATLVFVCTPTRVVAQTVLRVLGEAPGAVVTDVGSVKAPVVRAVEAGAHAGEIHRYVGGHPMGGSERSGPDGAAPSVVDGIVWALTPTESTGAESLDRLEAWIERAGSRPVRLDPARHDRLVAMVSHLPQVASTVLMGLAASEEIDEPDLLLLAAGGFRDLTRLASSSPQLWGEILISNRRAIAEAIDRYIDRLAGMRDLVLGERREQIEDAFELAKGARLRLAAKPLVRSGVAVIQSPIPDRPGALAELTAALGRAAVNIEDLQIVHSPEGGRGTVHVTVASRAADDALSALEQSRFEPVRIA